MAREAKARRRSAVGPVDQHSQLQLFMDGPREIATTIIRLSPKGTGPVVDKALAAKAGIGFIGEGKSIGDIVDAQGHAIAEALNKAGRPVRTIDLADLNARSAGRAAHAFHDGDDRGGAAA